MTATDLQRWTAALDAAMESDDEVDLDPVWHEVSEAVESDPGNASLRRLRIRLAVAFHDHHTRHADLRALHDLDPSDRDAWLELALLQHRWAFLLAEDENESADEGEAEDAEDDGNEAGAAAVQVTVRVAEPLDAGPRGALEAEALGWLATLLANHVRDAAFCAGLFARWNDAGIYAPWLRLRLALQAAAAHPRDDALQEVLAAAWADLANQAPEGWDPQGSPPMGFLFDLGGTLWDPFMIERARQSYTDLLARRPGDADLLRRRARLAEAAYDFAAAAADYAEAAQSLEEAASRSADADVREQTAAEAQELLAQAAACRGGRAALQQQAASSLDATLEQFASSALAPTAASPEAQALAAQWDAERQERLGSLSSELAALREAQLVVPSGPDAYKRDEMRALALNIAASVAGSVQMAPVQAAPVEPAAFEQDWATTLAPARFTFAHLGWQELGWAEWPAFRAMLGHQAVSSLWCDRASGTLALAFPVRGQVLLDLETELEDGRIFVTSLSRGRNFLTGGPEVDTLFIEPALPFEEACALHAARVAWAHASLGLDRAPATVAEAIAMQERARQAKTRFRLAESLTPTEALGVPHDFPEVFAPMLQEAAREALAPLRAAG